MENKKETPIMENQMDKKMENEMETAPMHVAICGSGFSMVRERRLTEKNKGTTTNQIIWG